MDSVSTGLKQTLTPALLENVRNFWFNHLISEDALILPGRPEMMRWFMRDSDFDKACVTQFQTALEKIISSGASATEILDAIDKSSPLNWLSILLLLDQVSRNCYRGDESKLVFGHFDPLAKEIAVRAIDTGILTQDPHLRYRLSYRIWFHMPLMHSENLAVHEKAVQVLDDTAKDINDLIDSDVSTLDDDEKRCHDVLSSQKEALDMFLKNTSDFEKKHKDIIEQFGRYPHRNAPLGRISTVEEIEYLEKGGEAFT
ncbi:uncharacterized protein N7443_005820 [Penicillium atrosanguineum]|uniref:uncharacterized protein n=1 Tax=Penicillium atrosanguineum TaxID=1132637 RepID=UPI002393436A|nr:uncharacterized protein N7443_005820 [Penicillium atrosanguineum]KAJ5128701.1 hypothetical protein N7526_006867 [Penicillium atrosanguineum]KAJ5300818.1 hypothetical protein N7443_005820 [Penicillium atrosanguineum]